MNSATLSKIHLASHSVRHRIAMVGVAVSWTLAALFLVLGWFAR